MVQMAYTHIHTAIIQHQFYTIIEPVSSEKLAQTHTSRNCCAHSRSCSLSPHQELKHPQANDHVWKKPEWFWAKVNWLNLVIGVCPDKDCQKHKEISDFCACVWEKLRTNTSVNASWCTVVLFNYVFKLFVHKTFQYVCFVSLNIADHLLSYY